jgi:xylose isomerase
MYYVLKHGGIGRGGVNFDAKVRRESFEPIDLFHAHIGSMDAFAKGLKIAAAIRADRALEDFIERRYSSWNDGIGAKIEAGGLTFVDLENYMLAKGDVPTRASGRQEMLENIINRYLDRC